MFRGRRWLVAGLIAALFAQGEAYSAPARNPRPEDSQATNQKADPNEKNADKTAALSGTTVINNPTYYLKPAPDPEQQKPFYKQWDFWVAAATLALVAATIAMAIPTWFILRDAKEAHRRELRAYVGVGHIYLESPHLGIHTWDTPIPAPPSYVYDDFVRITIMNTGKTPASNVAVFLNWLPFAFGDLVPLGQVLEEAITDEDRRNASRHILDAGMTSASTIAIRSSLSTFRAAQTKTVSIYFFGYIEYTDIFGATWRRHFRDHWEPWRDPEDRTVPAREGNFEEKIH